jgi:hypothetical protein
MKAKRKLRLLRSLKQGDDAFLMKTVNQIDRLEKELKQALWLIDEMNQHEGAEGWSEYLKTALRKIGAYD